MTYRERIDFILSYTDCDSMNVEEFNETVPEMTKLCDRADKYRWHDLRKNPEDLPKEHINYFPVKQSSFSDNVLVMTDKWYRPIVAYINLSTKGWFNPIAENTLEAEELGQVIAWREIEPFYEEK